ncbi:MAG: DUF2975 domain-containing protein [Gammaproteobacteria bacterium]|nr:DUF2975 domain-containing protein [Gammaproteobacteria bacterium]
MRRGASRFLKAVLMLVGIGALALLLWEPHMEGRNAHATPFEIYCNDPFLAYAYVASIPFFFALYQGFKLLGFWAEGNGYSPAAARALQTIRYCALAIIGFVALGEVFIFLGPSDDRAGGVFMGVVITVAAIAVATTMALLERSQRNARHMESATT